MNPLLLTDFYKVHHHNMYPEGTTMIYSNLTARKSRLSGVDEIVFFGLQKFIMTYIIDAFNNEFFNRDWKDVEEEYKKFIPLLDITHIKQLHELGYVPVIIKAVPEGTLVPIGVPCLTIRNTLPEFYWITNYLETLLSASLWQSITSATIAHNYRLLLDKYAIETTGSNEGVQWQGHDFSMRGMSSVESAILSGMGHLLSFTGTDTIPAIYALDKFYGSSGLIGASVPATEHSVMCMGTKNDEVGTFKALLDKYPTGIISVVSDTWDLWKVLTEYVPALKEQILSRDGKLVIRPDSGDPVKILTGWNESEIYEHAGQFYNYNDIEEVGADRRFVPKESAKALTKPEIKGVIELLWETFGGVVNEQGYKVLDSHIGAIYGDSITLERAAQICERLKAKGFASINVVLGIGLNMAPLYRNV